MTIQRVMPWFIWLVPLAATVVCAALAMRIMVKRGPLLTLTFSSAEGLNAGKTKLKYRNVDIGYVTALHAVEPRPLQPHPSSRPLLNARHDSSHALVHDSRSDALFDVGPDVTHDARVRVDVQLTTAIKDFAAADTRFWIVRPRIDGTGVSNLGTIRTGAYIAVDPGRANDRRTAFTGLDAPPVITRERRGRQFVLLGDTLGSVHAGAPIYTRDMQVGQVVECGVDQRGAGVAIRVFIDAPYDRGVSTHTRWWHASGVDLRLDAEGMRINMPSVAAVATGALAFQSPPSTLLAAPAPDGTRFDLADTRNDAMREPAGAPATVIMVFDQSLRGLQVGAPVDFRGVELGSVAAIGIRYDSARGRFTMPVTIHLFPDRLGRQYRASLGDGNTSEGRALLVKLVKQGLRGQLRTGNLLTNQLYVALDLFPNAAPVRIDMTQQPVILPTVPSTLEELQTQVENLVKQLDRMPLDQMGMKLNGAMQSANTLFKQLNGQFAPEVQDALTVAAQTFDAAKTILQKAGSNQSDLHAALTQLNRTLRTLNALTNYVEMHPESLLRGQAGMSSN